MSTSEEQAEKWKKLSERLAELEWPQSYTFKFIVENELERVAQLEVLFNSDLSTISYKESRNGKYVSFTAKEMMMSGDAVLQRYQDAASIEGIIAL